MSYYVILAHSRQTARPLQALVRSLDMIADESVEKRSLTLIVGGHESRDESGISTFVYLANSIDDIVRLSHAPPMVTPPVLLVDFIDPCQMTTISEAGDWNHLIALLILAFPEVRWHFGAFASSPPGFPAYDHSLMALVGGVAREPLLDPTGLREWVKVQTNETLSSRFDYVIPGRAATAAAMDEEKSCCYFNGYVAYRYGFRTDIVSSWALIHDLFGLGDRSAKGHGYAILLEDMSLNYPDKPNTKHLLSLSSREVQLPLLNSRDPQLESSSYRILVTSGYGADKKILEINRAYLEAKKAGSGAIVMKPIGGMIDMWRKAGLLRICGPGTRAGNAMGFVWPPASLHLANQNGGHGAPGKLVMIAEYLIQRVEALKSGPCTQSDLVRGAVLATEAAELLGGRAPPLALTAIALKHEFEIRFECRFIGVGFHFDVQGRINELVLESNAIGHSFATPMRASASLDAQSSILNRLAIVFRDEGRFEEESECMTALRQRHRRLQFKLSKSPGDWMWGALVWYAEYLLVSLRRFTVAITCWLFALTAIWFVLDRAGGWKKALVGTWGGFFGGNSAPPESSWTLLGLSCVVLLAGFFHLGIFVSFIYSLISRK